MRIQWNWAGRRWLWLGTALMVAASQLAMKAVLPEHPFGYVVILAAALGAFAFLTLTLRIEARRWWGMVILQLCLSGLAACVIHLPMYHHSLATPMALVNTAAIFLVLQGLLFALFGSVKPFGAVLLTVCWMYGIVEYEVFEFTENLISIGQILSVQTGLNVASNYRIVWGPFLLSATILYGFSMLALFRLREDYPEKLRVRAAALILALVAAILPARQVKTLKRRSWKSGALYGGYGIPLELLLKLRDYRIDPPEGYSAESAAALGRYAEEAGEESNGEKPAIIAIMFEAFSDLSVLGDFETNVDPIPYTRSLADESVHGSFLASTLAGGTSRTEWEFLTGNSMYFLPGDSIPFKQYVQGEQTSLVRVLKNQGYHTVGMHCFDGNGWDRYRVYPLMGFDDVYFEDDLQWDGRVRKYISDSAFVHQVIRLYEQRDASMPFFLFGVSMQNHGGYTYEGFEADVRVEGLAADCARENQYLSLTKLTDDAIRELIEHFRTVEEPVEILFFGDHQPGLSRPFYREIGTRQVGQKYLVPYVIWKNYDSRAEETPLTSANYLAVRTLREAGIPLPPYFAFLEDAERTLPALCALGYQYGDHFYAEGNEPDAAVAAKLREYETYQYATLFDGNVDRGLYDGGGE